MLATEAGNLLNQRKIRAGQGSLQCLAVARNKQFAEMISGSTHPEDYSRSISAVVSERNLPHPGPSGSTVIKLMVDGKIFMWILT